MSPQPPPDLDEDKERETNVLIEAAPGSPSKGAEDGPGRPLSPAAWFRMLARELHWSFVFGVVATYGISQGLGGGITRVASDYYWKDVQRVQPSAAQVYQGVTSIPWMVKPLWGLLTDVLPVVGYRRRPYFILAGFIGVIAMLIISLHSKLHALLALLALMTGSASVAIADVTIDACVAENSIMYPHLAADMISLNGFCASVGGLIGFSTSGFLVRAIGAQGFIGFMFAIGSIGSLVGVILYQNILKDHSFRNLLFSSQLLLSLSGMLDLMLVLRLNLKMGIPDYYFAVIDEGVSKMINRIKWMPLLVLSSKLCPPGIEGTFYALLMSIDNIGSLTGSWVGGLILHLLKITRTEFKNLWAAILIRNAMRLLPLSLLALVPRSYPNSNLLPSDLLNEDGDDEAHQMENVELTSLCVDRGSFPDKSLQDSENREGPDVEQDDDEASLLANRS
ncbi:probable folate-biopterin transporter 2 isoform X2 [Phragmites australis]|uniref:probable folate-biopterin transporter 2 isoform X2 n=1 Tax=Phragmites australis TaxID=29695 RepID=UPI002D774003|nr:probable folate-biopterin transporter 2 isoform X2 [Phragmites australis]